MPGQPSSNPKPNNFSGIHKLATSFTAIVGVAITAWQTLGSGSAPPQPVQMMVVHQPADAAQRVATVEYQPSVITSEQAATVLDVNVLPEGKIDTTGNAIQSFTLQTTPGKQTFTIPEPATGKALWLRVSGPSGATNLAVGDFKILK